MGDDLKLRVNATMTELGGLNALTTVGGEVRVASNYKLVAIDGFSSLTSVGGDLYIDFNGDLESLGDVGAGTGLSNITSVSGDLQISNCHGLLGVDGLLGLEYVGGNVKISNNENLENLDGLSNLVTVEGGSGNHLLVEKNASLTSMEFPSLTELNGRLWIRENDALLDISGFNALVAIERLEGELPRVLQVLRRAHEARHVARREQGRHVLGHHAAAAAAGEVLELPRAGAELFVV